MAMRMVVDRKLLIGKLGEYAFSPAGSFLPTKSRAMSFASSTLEEAATWLSRSSYQGETLSLFISEGKLFDIVGKWIRRRCRQIGIHIKLVPMTKANFLSDHVDREADMAIMGEVFQSDVELGLIELYKNKSTMVYRFMDDDMRALVDEKLSEVLRMANREKRMGALEEMEEMFGEELWLLCNFHVKRMDRYHPALQGFVADSFGGLDFSKLWVKSFVTTL
jgi:MarR-like DNA-binding transcriptional regulator SgrR of sgrS sRNA